MLNIRLTIGAIIPPEQCVTSCPQVNLYKFKMLRKILNLEDHQGSIWQALRGNFTLPISIEHFPGEVIDINSTIDIDHGYGFNLFHDEKITTIITYRPTDDAGDKNDDREKNVKLIQHCKRFNFVPFLWIAWGFIFKDDLYKLCGSVKNLLF